MLQIIFEAIKNANQEIIHYIQKDLLQNDFLYVSQGYGGDKTSQIDQKCENIFKHHLLCFGDIYSEESGLIHSIHPSKLPNSYFVIDPLDGSDNFLNSIAYYGSSVALIQNDVTILSVICNFVDGSMTYKIEDTLFIGGTSISSIGIFERSWAKPLYVEQLFAIKEKFRSPGAVALSLAKARFTKFVLFYGTQRPFDLKAALHINSDLNIYQNNDTILITKDEVIFENIKKALLLE